MFACSCRYISCLLQVTSRPPTRDSNFTIDRFSPWPRERDTIEFEATPERSVRWHSSFSVFSPFLPFSLSLLSCSPTRERLRGRLAFRIGVRSKVLRSKLGPRVGRKERGWQREVFETKRSKKRRNRAVGGKFRGGSARACAGCNFARKFDIQNRK